MFSGEPLPARAFTNTSSCVSVLVLKISQPPAINTIVMIQPKNGFPTRKTFLSKIRMKQLYKPQSTKLKVEPCQMRE